MVGRIARVCIIGAGPSGLVSCHEALRAGLDVRVFERARSVGGVWRAPDDGGLVWNDMRANLSAHSCVFSDWPWERAAELDSNCAIVADALGRGKAELSIFPTEIAVRAYLRTYCDAFGLWKNIEFESEVCQIHSERTDDGEEAWRVTVETAGRMHDARFDYVVVCVGVFHTPSIPKLYEVGDGVIHANKFSGTNDVGEHVLVVGGAFSGCEIAAVIARERNVPVVHSVNKQAWIVPRMIPRRHGSVPIDLFFYRRDLEEPLRGERERSNVEAAAYFRKLCPKQAEGSVMVHTRSHEPQFLVVSDEYVNLVMGGKVQVVGRVDDVRREDGHLICKAGETAVVADSVLLCTGYYPPSLDFLPQIVRDGVRASKDQFVPLLLDRGTLPAYSTDWDTKVPVGASVHRRPLHERMAFVGMYRGPYFGILELQARWVVHALCVRSTSSVHPSPCPPVPLAEVVRGVRREFALRNRKPRPQFPHPDYVGLCNTLAAAIGALPDVDDNRDGVAHMVRNGPVVPAQYRLRGVHADRAAAVAVIRKAYRQSEHQCT
ncbi:Dimethylaniline monooxygenase [N-oxide-forming] 4 [Gracilariopsis chorda]|uniref:Dimethylaniline monooxygenase [N-oxide-forming] 4 n=1 Tax=Gracilariopsis chorda TaxID=448386 RepID=A0A2V3IXQ3_9FLOR|nr:Dimethylaniline monooxygenase [N-oxide-forming] 4 [Gracilariopsis chorda]|eukprot:PXF46845.1 Dimethylaniline monooxygenase [N-oxide-forming] 4 [Gracilariopsis chorda]